MKYEVKETVSNLAYATVGMIGIAAHNDALFLVTVLQMSFGSFLYHKYKARNPDIDRADWFAIHLMLNASTAHMIDTRWAWFIMGAYTVLYGYVLMKRLPNVYYDVALSAVPCLAACFYTKGLIPSLIIVGVFVLSIIIRKMDQGEDQSFHHDSWGHTIWHVLTGVMVYLIWFL
jgi:hypothetical protein